MCCSTISETELSAPRGPAESHLGDLLDMLVFDRPLRFDELLAVQDISAPMDQFRNDEPGESPCKGRRFPELAITWRWSEVCPCSVLWPGGRRVGSGEHPVEAEDVTGPADAWQADRYSDDKWNLWSTDKDAAKKSSAA